ncbi:MAG: glycosyltransferase family 4 protein [Methylotenera sp.]
MKILFLSKGENSSSTRYRAMQYFPDFIKAGWEPSHVTISGGVFSIITALLAAKSADVVVLLRKTFPFPIFWLIRKFSKKLLFDFDDAIFCNSNGSHSKTRLSRFHATISKCDYILAGNHYLANEAKKSNPNTVVIPTSLDTRKYDLRPAAKIHNKIVLVWIGSSSTKKYLTEIIPYLEKAAESFANLELKVIADFTLSSKVLKIESMQWSEKTEASELCNSDIGIAPMPEDNWTRGKCALKVLQYMAAGLPVISSKSGVNATVVEHQQTGILITDNNEWKESIVQLCINKNTRLAMGEKGKSKAQQAFDLHVVFEDIMSVIKRL